MRRFVVSFALGDGAVRWTPEPARYHGCAVAFAGYVANPGELRAEARRRGHAAPRDDAELFALAYRWWGEALQARVLGEYAVALHDERGRRLLVTHDALGIVPAFVARLADRVVAGSHLADVARRTGGGTLDDEYVADHLATGAPLGGRTPYTTVRRLLPGRTLEVSGGRVRETTSWDIAAVAPLRLAGAADYEERARELLADGVRAALDAGGPVWSELSGGLDSSSVFCAAAASGRGVPALSVVFGAEHSADERPWMEAVLRRHPSPWHTIDAADHPPFRELPSIAFAEPNATMPVWSLYRRYDELLAQHGVTALLTGLGGDQVFAGDSPQPRHLSDPLLQLDPVRFVRGVRAWQRGSPAQRSLLHLLAANVVRPALRHARGKSVCHDGSANFAIPNWIDGRFARSMDLPERLDRRYAPRCRTVGDQHFSEGLYTTIGAIAGMARDAAGQSFAYRHPLLYRPLVEFLFAIPWEQRVEPNRDRALQRRALRGILPDAVRLRHGKRSPAQAYFEGLRAGGDWLAMLRRSQLAARGYVDERAWLEALDRARFGRMPSMRHFLSAATLECYLHQREQISDLTVGSTTRTTQGETA